MDRDNDYYYKLKKYDLKIKSIKNKIFIDDKISLIKKIIQDIKHLQDYINEDNLSYVNYSDLGKTIILKVNNKMIEFIDYDDSILYTKSPIHKVYFDKVKIMNTEEEVNTFDFLEDDFLKFIQSQVILGFIYNFQQKNKKKILDLVNKDELNPFTKQIVELTIFEINK